MLVKRSVRPQMRAISGSSSSSSVTQCIYCLVTVEMLVPLNKDECQLMCDLRLICAASRRLVVCILVSFLF